MGDAGNEAEGARDLTGIGPPAISQHRSRGLPPEQLRDKKRSDLLDLAAARNEVIGDVRGSRRHRQCLMTRSTRR